MPISDSVKLGQPRFPHAWHCGNGTALGLRGEKNVMLFFFVAAGA